MKHTCCCGASIEVSSMYVTSERIEWDRFRREHEGCAGARLPNTIRFKLPMNHPLVADHPLKKKCCECGSIFTLADVFTCGKCYANFAKAYMRLADDGSLFDEWWRNLPAAEVKNEVRKLWIQSCPTNPPKRS